ncbi:MAG: 50S ribosomal protein L10 [candidate division Zixibacteria bacterium]|nr:50S ribosomal protein L10 [candidate division Zixibacteria bacterium]
MPTQAKIDAVAGLKERFSSARNIFITDYAGLNVEQITKLRKNLRENGVSYIVAKNTLLRIAAREAGYADLEKYLTGPVAVAFSATEPNVPAKILFDAYKENKEKSKPEIRAFYIDRQPFAGANAERIAKMPPREILLSQLVAAVQAPIAGLIGTLDSIVRELIGTIDAMAAKKGE